MTYSSSIQNKYNTAHAYANHKSKKILKASVKKRASNVSPVPTLDGIWEV